MEKNNSEPMTREEESLRFVCRFYQKGKNDTSAAWRKILPSLVPEKKERRFSVRLYRMAGMAALLAGLVSGALYWWNNLRTDWVTVTAGTEAKVLSLPDKSRITLSPETSLRYDRMAYGRDERRMELAGKAFFEVEHLDGIPFRVVTPEATVQVLGTRFQVEVAGDSTVAFVISGKVRFATPHQYADLTADMRAVSRQGEELRTGKLRTRNELAWLTGRLTYRNTPLRQVVEDLERLYHVRITGLPQKELFLTSEFDRMRLSDIIHIINQTLDTNLTLDAR